MDQQDDRHVVHIQLGCTGAGAVKPTSCCVVCTEPLAGVTVGSCGHGAVCPRCMIDLRFVQGNRYPSVVVAAKEAVGTRGGGGDPVVPVLPFPPPPTSKKGALGEYWYHGDTAAYFHGEEQYEEATDASKKTRPRYQLWFWFVLLYSGSICVGTVLGSSFADATKGDKAMKVLVYVLGMCIPLSVASLLWCPFAWSAVEID